jgi:hypothetical protein
MQATETDLKRNTDRHKTKRSMSQMKSNHRYDGNLPFGRAEIKALLGLQEALTGLQEQVAEL